MGGNERRIRGFIGYDADLCRAGKQINADLRKQLSLCLRDIRIPRTGYHIRRAHSKASVRHGGGQGLHAAQGVNLVRTGGVQRIKLRRIYACRLVRRRASNNVIHTGRLRGVDAHDRGRDEWILAARNVAANVGYRDQFLAQPNAGLNFHLETFHTIALMPRETSDVVVGVFEILLERFRKMRRRLSNLVDQNTELGLVQ